VDNRSIPQGIAVQAARGANNVIQLPRGHTLMDTRWSAAPGQGDVVEIDGLRLLSLSRALCSVPGSFFRENHVDCRSALSGIGDSSDLLRPLLPGGRTVVAGRLAGALRAIGRDALADDILEAMRAAGHALRETNPFEGQPVLHRAAGSTPVRARLEQMWEDMRAPLLEIFPEPPGLPQDAEAYLASVDEVYKTDSYHSLSIEGFRVTPELIERVCGGDWDPESREEDRKSRDALAARGYWQAFQKVRESIGAIFSGEPAGSVLRNGFRSWYREMFQPFAQAGEFDVSALAGFRTSQVFISGSRHVPPEWRQMAGAMEGLFDLIGKEKHAGVRAVLGHWAVGFIHPYMDGNGRMARFLMNAMLASGGYPWTVIRVEDRPTYMAALEAASVDRDIRPFGEFLAAQVRAAMPPEDGLSPS
jgi:hypothetical protein